MRVVIRADGINQVASGDERTLGDIALADNHLPGVGYSPVGIHSHIHRHRIDLHGLINIARHNAVIVPLFLKILIIRKGTLIHQEQSPVDIGFDGCPVGRERKKARETDVYALSLRPDDFAKGLARGPA